MLLLLLLHRRRRRRPAAGRAFDGQRRPDQLYCLDGGQLRHIHSRHRDFLTKHTALDRSSGGWEDDQRKDTAPSGNFALLSRRFKSYCTVSENNFRRMRVSGVPPSALEGLGLFCSAKDAAAAAAAAAMGAAGAAAAATGGDGGGGSGGGGGGGLALRDRHILPFAAPRSVAKLPALPAARVAAHFNEIALEAAAYEAEFALGLELQQQIPAHLQTKYMERTAVGLVAGGAAREGHSHVRAYICSMPQGYAPCVFSSLLSLSVCKSQYRRVALVGDLVLVYSNKENGHALLFMFIVDEIVEQAVYQTTLYH